MYDLHPLRAQCDNSNSIILCPQPLSLLTSLPRRRLCSTTRYARWHSGRHNLVACVLPFPSQPGMPPNAIELPKRNTTASLQPRPPRIDDSHTQPADEQTSLISSTTRRTLYTPPPASPTLSPASSSRSHSSQSVHLSDLEDSTVMDSALLAHDGGERDEPFTAHHTDHLILNTVSDSYPAASSPLSPSQSAAAWYRLKAPRREALVGAAVLALAVLAVLAYIAYSRYEGNKPPPFTQYTTCDVFCTGPVLAAYQMSGMFNDSKSFVDFPLLRSPSDVFHAFLALPNTSLPTLTAFLYENFNTSATDLLPWSIPDWQPHPPLLAAIADARFRNFSAALNDLWFLLGRQIHPDVYLHPERHTLLPLRHDKMVVPGGRFREFYYWDTYWIVRGLLLGGMVHTARLVVENLLAMVDAYGFVPNGSRQYYLTRSQPPFLALMVDVVGSWQGGADGGAEWMSEQLGGLEKEYAYWMTEGAHMVYVNDSAGRTHRLNRYYASVQYPRPESYLEDVLTARSLAAHNHSAAHQQRASGGCSADSPDCDLSDTWSQQAKALFSELSASAETGWDFSSRWFADRRNISTAETSHILPVDLNAVLYAVERVLSKMFNATNDTSKGATYAAAADQRLDAMYSVLFDEDKARAGRYVWRDYDFHARQLDGDVSVLSNYLPLWTHAYDSRVNVSRVVDGLLASGLVQAGGLLTSLDDIGQQWDCPNAWPPLQHMVMEGIATASYTPANDTTAHNLLALLDTLPSAPTQPYTPLPLPASAPPTAYGASLAYYLSSSWLYGNALLFNSTGAMYEKYYALARGAAGHGGEYEVQAGFGWTNGVALIMLEQYGNVLEWERVAAMQPPVEITGQCTRVPPMPRRS